MHNDKGSLHWHIRPVLGNAHGSSSLTSIITSFIIIVLWLPSRSILLSLIYITRIIWHENQAYKFCYLSRCERKHCFGLRLVSGTEKSKQFFPAESNTCTGTLNITKQWSFGNYLSWIYNNCITFWLITDWTRMNSGIYSWSAREEWC